MAPDIANVVHTADVGMRDFPRRANLAMKLGKSPRILRQIFGQKFQRDLLAQAQIVGAIDLTHAATAE